MTKLSNSRVNETINAKIGDMMKDKASARAAWDIGGHKATVVPYAVMTLDKDYRVLGYCEAAASLFGFRCNTAIGTSVEQILPGVQASVAKRQVTRETRQPLTVMETRALHTGGHRFPVAIGIREHHPQGEARYLLLVRVLTKGTARSSTQAGGLHGWRS